MGKFTEEDQCVKGLEWRSEEDIALRMIMIMFFVRFLSIEPDDDNFFFTQYVVIVYNYSFWDNTEIRNIQKN